MAVSETDLSAAAAPLPGEDQFFGWYTGAQPKVRRVFWTCFLGWGLDSMDGLVYQYMIPVVVMSLVLSFAATLYPSWRAAQTDPVEALRYE